MSMMGMVMMTILIRREPWISKRHLPQLQQGRGGEDFIHHLQIALLCLSYLSVDINIRNTSQLSWAINYTTTIIITVCRRDFGDIQPSNEHDDFDQLHW